jgi:hypothetical protein
MEHTMRLSIFHYFGLLFALLGIVHVVQVLRFRQKAQAGEGTVRYSRRARSTIITGIEVEGPKRGFVVRTSHLGKVYEKGEKVPILYDPASIRDLPPERGLHINPVFDVRTIAGRLQSGTNVWWNVSASLALVLAFVIMDLFVGR